MPPFPEGYFEIGAELLDAHGPVCRELSCATPARAGATMARACNGYRIVAEEEAARAVTCGPKSLDGHAVTCWLSLICRPPIVTSSVVPA